jgi:hypothetical protein
MELLVLPELLVWPTNLLVLQWRRRRRRSVAMVRSHESGWSRR